VTQLFRSIFLATIVLSDWLKSLQYVIIFTRRATKRRNGVFSCTVVAITSMWHVGYVRYVTTDMIALARRQSEHWVSRYGAHSVVTTRLVTTEHSLAHWWIVGFVWGLFHLLSACIRKVMVEGESHWTPLCRVIRRHERHSEVVGTFFSCWRVGRAFERTKYFESIPFTTTKYSIHALIYLIENFDSLICRFVNGRGWGLWSWFEV